MLVGLAGAIIMLVMPPTLEVPWGPLYVVITTAMIVPSAHAWWRQKRAVIAVPGQEQGRTTWQLSVRRWGSSGPTVILLHGLGASGAFWHRTADALGERFVVLAPDLLGFGRSPWPNIDYTLDDHLDALDALVASEALERREIVLGGHSLGAVMALAWARRHPDWFARVVLLGLPCYRSPGEARRHAATLGPLAYATVAKPRLGELMCALMCLSRPLWWLVAPRLAPQFPPDVARDWVLHTWESYSRTLNRCILDLDVAKLASEVAKRNSAVHLLHGHADREVPLETLEGLARTLRWSLTMVPDASHFLPLEQPRLCAAAIESRVVAA